MNLYKIIYTYFIIDCFDLNDNKNQMKCCYSGPHCCEMCQSDFPCGGTGGCCGDIRTSSGMIVCPDCFKFAPRRSICWKCYKIFLTSSELFRHLRENKDHMIDLPKYCTKCGEVFFIRNIYKGVSGFYNRDEIFDHLYICNPNTSWYFSGDDTETLKKYLDEDEKNEYERLIKSLKEKWNLL